MPQQSGTNLILFMGRIPNHALTSIQHYAPDSVHIITSNDFRSAYVRRLNDWSKKFGFRKGTVQGISDLFEPTSISSLMNCVNAVTEHEYKLSDGEKMFTSRWRIGLTGGTMHMAAVATMAATILDAHAFYVIKPNNDETVVPNKHVFELPGLSALKMAMVLNPSDIEKICVAKNGKIPELFAITDIEPWMLGGLERRGAITIKRNKWELSEMGESVFELLQNGPIFKFLLEDEKRVLEALEAAEDDEYYYHA
jgi:hypothetical protein